MSKTVLITGASGNMGRAMLEKFLAEEYRVLGTLVPADPVKLDIIHGGLDTAEVDLLNEREAGEMVHSAWERYGSIEAAVLTVGGFAMASIAETSLEDIQKQLRLNFTTAYNVARPLFVHMMQAGSGRIFLVGSRPGMDMANSKGMTAYGLSKSLIFRLAELMNLEAGNSDVITQVIVPSTIDTPQNRRSMPDADFSQWVKPETIAQRTIAAIQQPEGNRLLLF